MRILFSAFAGGFFGLGLLISGMTDTARVQGWLDLFGAWDPTLAFVLGGAIIPMFIAWRIAARRKHALLGDAIPALPPQVIDAKLLGGSALFGVGWALVGLCPGPALAVLGFGGQGAVIFAGAMAAGMVGWRWATTANGARTVDA
ncbi:MAG: hypothetical protein GC146_13195 [Limimaricola sp.]|uniref:DUF6691 family protein n=1 Tax=Limimaricola sp. TaxID=2211665 RepID=UPI001DD02A2B|nr:DUF6691 family protein [Limimaricola sp.]MBI1418172.1 hypothetical protein [Limimaricola sp.]